MQYYFLHELLIIIHIHFMVIRVSKYDNNKGAQIHGHLCLFKKAETLLQYLYGFNQTLAELNSLFVLGDELVVTLGE